MANLLKVEKIRCLDAAEPITEPLSFAIQEGEIAAILSQGCSIAGTILRAIQGQIRVDDGKIVLAGDHISNSTYHMPASKRGCSLIPARASLIPHLSAADNIALALHGLPKRERKARLLEVLEEVELLGAADWLAADLPEEERQRTGLARALASEPLLLLWEEPFGPYPETLHMGLVDEIEQIAKQRHLSCLISTSSLNAGLALADRMGVFADNRLLQWDSPANLYHCPGHRDVARATGNGVLMEGFIHPDNSLSSELGTLQFQVENEQIRCGKAIEFLLRPEHILHDRRSLKCGTIIRKRFQGGHIDYRIRLEGGSVIPVNAPSPIDLALGKGFCFRVEMEHLMVFQPDREAPVDLGRCRSI